MKKLEPVKVFGKIRAKVKDQQWTVNGQPCQQDDVSRTRVIPRIHHLSRMILAGWWRVAVWLVNVGQSGADTWQPRFCPILPSFQNFGDQGGSNPWPPGMTDFLPEGPHQTGYGGSCYQNWWLCIYVDRIWGAQKKGRWSRSTPRLSKPLVYFRNIPHAVDSVKKYTIYELTEPPYSNKRKYMWPNHSLCVSIHIKMPECRVGVSTRWPPTLYTNTLTPLG